MIVDGYREVALGLVLSDDVVVEVLLDVLGLGQGLEVELGGVEGLSLGLLEELVLLEHVHRQGYAVGADLAVDALQEEGDFVLGTSAEDAVSFVCLLSHAYFSSRLSTRSIIP